MAMRPRRSVLYVPGDNEHALEKAKKLPANSIIIDLEDSVAPANKEMARRHAVSVIREGGLGTREAVLRVNPIETPWGMPICTRPSGRHRMPYSFRRCLTPAMSSARPKS